MAKEYNAKATIEAILSVSAKLFLQKGFDKTSMMDIATAAGISKGAIYHHFKSKDEIIKCKGYNRKLYGRDPVFEWKRTVATYFGEKYRESGSTLFR